MKKKILLFLTMLSLTAVSSARVQIHPGLSLDQCGNSYIIQYNNDGISAIDTILTDEENEYKFSYIQLTPDYYDYIGEEYSPMLPAYTLHLELPQNATNVQLNIRSLEYIPVRLNSPYIPVISTIIGQPETIYYDHDLYNDDSAMKQYYPEWAVLSKTYTHLFATGVDFSFYPVHYYAKQNTEVMTRAEFEITYDGDPIESIYNNIETTSAHFFDNYCDSDFYTPLEDPIIDNEPYLIITERAYADSIKVFKTFKEALGYQVFVKYIEDIGNTPDEIRRCIISYYTGNHLKYVLLAGSLKSIPFSAGEKDNFTNPPTDIYYTCLDNIDINKQKDYHTHVFLGRWDVYNKEQLSHIMRKTIKSERSMYQNNSHRIASFSGTDNPKLSNIAQAKWIKTDVINKANYLDGLFYDGRYAKTSQVSYQDMKDELEESCKPLWMFLYFGHGHDNWMASPYRFHNSDIDNCQNYNFPYQPFGFSFACRNGNLYGEDCFARDWMNVKNGGIGILASSVDAIIECNRWFSRKLFSPLTQYQYSMTIGEFIANAKEKYYYADKVAYRRHHIAKYIFLGDPSLYIHGLSIPKNFQLAPAINHSSDAIPDKVRILSMDGELIQELSYTEFQVHCQSSGLFILLFLDNKNNILSITKAIY